MNGRDWVDLRQPIAPVPGPAMHGSTKIRVDRTEAGTADGRPVISVTHLEMAAHSGTHVDAARHFHQTGRTIDQYPAGYFIGRGVALDVARSVAGAVTADDLQRGPAMPEAGDIVLLRFGFARHYGTARYLEHPYLANDAVDWLVDLGVRMVGVDALSPEFPTALRPPGFDFPVHSRLLGADILIIENLGAGIDKLTGRRVEVLAVPVLIPGADGAPAAVLARPLGRTEE